MSSEALERATGVPLATVVPAPQLERTVIEPTRGWAALKLAELWRYRELIYYLTWRDIKVRYKQTGLGVAWAILQPVTQMIIFTVIFGRVARLPSEGIPYPIFTFSALLPWTYFSYVLQQSGGSLVGNASMISKIYFPRLVLPTSSALSGLMDFCIAFTVLIGMMVYYHVHPHVTMLLLPLFLLLAVVTALGVGIWLSALSVEYRDVKYILPVLTQLWMFASPVAYSARLVKGKMAILYALNPMSGVIQGFRWALLGAGRPPGVSLILPAAIAVIILVSGLFYFRRMEQTFADVV